MRFIMAHVEFAFVDGYKRGLATIFFVTLLTINFSPDPHAHAQTDKGTAKENPDEYPKPIPPEVVREEEEFPFRRLELASRDLTRACELSYKHLDRLKSALGEDHWIVSTEETELQELETFRDTEPNTQEKLRQALGAQRSAEKAMKERDFRRSKKILTEEALPVWRELSSGGFYHERALSYCALLDHHLGNYDSAKRWAAQATRLTVDLYGEGHVQHADALLTEGAMDLMLKDYKAAESKFLESSKISKQHVAKGHSILGSPLAYLTVLYLETGKLDKAILYARRTMDSTLLLGPIPEDSNITAKNFALVAAVLVRKRRHVEAQRVLDEVFRLAENPIGSSPPAALAAYYEVQALNYQYLERDSDARKAVEKMEMYRQAAVGVEPRSQ